MIRRIKLKTKLKIPAKLRGLAKRYSSRSFEQIELEQSVASVVGAIPYPENRQVHSLVVLGSSYIEEHTDTLRDFISTSYCIPIHIPKGARLWQCDQRVSMVSGTCYSFNQSDYHKVDAPEDSRTYSAFLIVDILKIPRRNL